MPSYDLYWKNGKRKRSIVFDQQGIRKEQLWDELGNLLDEGEFLHGKPIGLHRRWNEKGALIEEIEYLEDGRASLRTWDRQGNLIKKDAIPSSALISLLPVPEKLEEGDPKEAFSLFLERFPHLGLFAFAWKEKKGQSEFLSGEVLSADVLYIYGLGLGGPYLQLRHWLQENKLRKIVFLEDDPGNICYFFRCKESLLLLQDPQVFIEIVDLKQKTLQKIAHQYPGTLEVAKIPSKSSFRFEKIKQKLFRFSSIFSALRFDILQSHVLFSHFKENAKQLRDSFYANAFHKKFHGMPAIVCGAGPSLDAAIPFLKTLSSRALIIAGGSTLAALSSQGVPIHFGLAVDPNLEEYRRLKNSFAFDTPLLYSLRVHPKVFSTCNGPFGFMRSSMEGVLDAWLAEEIGLKGPCIGKHLSIDAMSVTTMAAAWAAFLGCSTVIFCGVDLAYTDRKRYAEGVGVHEASLLKTLSAHDRMVEGKDSFGNPVSTAVRWAMEARSFSQFAKKHPRIRFINTSKKGLAIPGIPTVSLEEAALDCLQKEYDFAKLIAQGTCPMQLKGIDFAIQKLEQSIENVISHLEVLASQKKGSKALSELEMEEELAFRLLFEEAFALLERNWENCLQFAQRFKREDLLHAQDSN